MVTDLWDAACWFGRLSVSFLLLVALFGMEFIITLASWLTESSGELNLRSTMKIPYDIGSVTWSDINDPNPDRFVDTLGIPITVHSAEKQMSDVEQVIVLRNRATKLENSLIQMLEDWDWLTI